MWGTARWSCLSEAAWHACMLGVADGVIAKRCENGAGFMAAGFVIMHMYKNSFFSDLVTMRRRVAHASQPACPAELHPCAPPHTATAAKPAQEAAPPRARDSRTPGI